MSDLPIEQPLSLRDTAKGVALRAGILSAATLLGRVWIFSIPLKFASTSIRALLGVLMIVIAGGLVTLEVRRVRRGEGRSRLNSRRFACEARICT